MAPTPATTNVRSLSPPPRAGRAPPTVGGPLARYFGTPDHFWLNLQTRYDLEIEKNHLGAALEAIRPLKSA